MWEVLFGPDAIQDDLFNKYTLPFYLFLMFAIIAIRLRIFLFSWPFDDDENMEMIWRVMTVASFCVWLILIW